MPNTKQVDTLCAIQSHRCFDSACEAVAGQNNADIIMNCLAIADSTELGYDEVLQYVREFVLGASV